MIEFGQVMEALSGELNMVASFSFQLPELKSLLKPGTPPMRGFDAGSVSLCLALVFSFSAPCVFAEDVKTNSAEGWESPAKLKPFVKLPAETGSSSVTAPPVGPAKTTTAADQKEIDSAVQSILKDAGPDTLRLRFDGKAAKRLAKYHWLDKVAAANPRVVEAITDHKSAAKVLAKHPRLSEIAEADHYVCRRITKWKSAARVLAANGEVKEVALLDPEGIYSAIQRDKKIIRILSRNPIFDQMIVDNPDLGRIISKYM